jgi:hypothetical protein
VQFIGYAENINIMESMKRAVSEVYDELKKTAKEVGLKIS